MQTKDNIQGPSKLVPSETYRGIGLCCPRCRKDMDGLQCFACEFLLQERDGILHALTPERAAYYAQFISDYERIRSAEGRESQSEEFYLALPYKDMTGHNSSQWKIRARSFDYLLRRVLKSLPRGSAILDLGAGNCWMSYRLACRGYKPVAVDLLVNQRDGLGAAMHYNRHLPTDIPRFQAEVGRLPFQREQFDAVIFNASFHYAEDYSAALGEALRCLKTGGIVVISDTPWYSREESGRQMIAERHAFFQKKYETASDSIKSLEFLTDERLQILEHTFGQKWSVHRPWYGWSWAMRPWSAKLHRRREPSRFRIYGTRKHG